MRRGIGIGAIQNQKAAQEKYESKGAELQQAQFKEIKVQFEMFRSSLEQFASNHRNDIVKNSQLRKMFQEMCASIGVDPLTSAKGFWSVLGMGDFYYELGVQIIEVCLALNTKTGGLISVDELTARLNRLRSPSTTSKDGKQLIADDVMCAVRKLSVLGNGFRLFRIGTSGRYMVQSVPVELSLDKTDIINYLSGERKCFFTTDDLKSNFGWIEERVEKNVVELLMDGMVWVDRQADHDSFWFPGLFIESLQSNS